MKAAIYARYSTSLQREQSIDDQHRVCERLAERHGFQVVARFSDQAISGGTTQRPGYQAMLTAARRHGFNVIVAEDTSRLWRNLAEQAPRLAELSDIGVAVVTHDLDTREESAGILGPVAGAMAEQYRKEIGRRTRRGLEGLARNAKPTGGKAYGHIAARDSGTGQVEVNAEQAAVIVRIYRDYAAGMSPKVIAGALNRERVPSPGSSWAKGTRRATSWRWTALYGQPSRGVGILNNESYVGRIIWNRFRWMRSAADSSKRRCIQNPRSEWITRQDERLRIVPDDLWQRVKARQLRQSERVGSRIKAGLPKDQAGRTGAGHKFLFSGLLECAHCGGSIAMVNKLRYGCSAFQNGAACSNRATFSRTVIEHELTAGIRSALSQPKMIEEARRRIVSALRKKAPQPKAPTARIAELRAQIGNFVEAIGSGALRASPALAERLVSAETELATLQQPAEATQVLNVEALTPGIADRYLRAVERLPETLRGLDIERGREQMRQLIGAIQVQVTDTEIRFRTKAGEVETALARFAGGQSAGKSVFMVAGVGFEPTTFGL